MNQKTIDQLSPWQKKKQKQRNKESNKICTSCTEKIVDDSNCAQHHQQQQQEEKCKRKRNNYMYRSEEKSSNNNNKYVYLYKSNISNKIGDSETKVWLNSYNNNHVNIATYQYMLFGSLSSCLGSSNFWVQ